MVSVLKEFIAHEFRFLMWSVGCGAMLGAFYWGITVFRRLVEHHKFFECVEDVAYWIFAAFTMFAVILVANDGAVRWFSVAGMLAGMVIISYVLKKMEKCIKLVYSKLFSGRLDKIRKARDSKDGRKSSKKKEKCESQSE